MHTLSLDTVAKYAKYVVAVSIPVLYLQGIGFYQGKLAGYGINPSFYPLSLEDALLEAFSFYLETIPYIFLIAVGWTIIALACSWVDSINKGKSPKPIKWAEKLFFFLFQFILKNKGNFIGPGLLFFSIYAIVVLAFAVAIPYQVGIHKNTIRLQKIIKIYPKETKSLTIKDGKNSKTKNVNILKFSKDYISFYEGNSVYTLPCSKVDTIENKIKKLPNKAFHRTR